MDTIGTTFDEQPLEMFPPPRKNCTASIEPLRARKMVNSAPTANIAPEDEMAE
jgi:hypothetical protein